MQWYTQLVFPSIGTKSLRFISTLASLIIVSIYVPLPNFCGIQSFNVRRGGDIWYLETPPCGIDDGLIFVSGVDGWAAAAEDACLLCVCDDRYDDVVNGDVYDGSLVDPLFNVDDDWDEDEAVVSLLRLLVLLLVGFLPWWIVLRAEYLDKNLYILVFLDLDKLQ